MDTNMQTIDEIKKHLRWGDLKVISEISGYSYVYVKKVFQKKRLNDDILETAKALIKKREEVRKNNKLVRRKK
jgi:hypothetical protein